jgi:predicted 3-demethylubiquinone-9 3-methyltransferase (glyoxalase superfamily)
MKTFLEWMEGGHGIEGWDKMPRDQRELIHYHRAAEAYRHATYEYEALLERLLRELEKTMMCGGIADKYGIELRAVEREVRRMLAGVPPPL